MSVEEIVAAFEANAENGGYDDDNLADILSVGNFAFLSPTGARGERRWRAPSW